MTATTPTPPARDAGIAVNAELLRSQPEAWDRFVASASAPSFLQATPWAAVKRANGWRAARLAVDGEAGPIGAQVLVRHPSPLPKGFGYAPRGPLLAAPLDPAGIRRFTDAALAAAPGLGIAHLRIDPEVEDTDGTLATALREAGWRPAPDIQPASTRLIDLTVGEEALWSGVRKKTRQLVRRAERAGVRVVAGGPERLGDLHRIVSGVMERRALPSRSEGFFRDLWTAFAAHDQARMLLAEGPEGGVVSATLLVGWGPRIVALYGGTTPRGRELDAKYALNWEVLRQAHAAGYTTYDAWGLPNAGVAFFKAGWGGREGRWVGAWDLVVDPAGRAIFEGAVRARGIVRRLRRRLGGGSGGTAGDEAADGA
jgi:lipid II:glycine glycyltransferase (peptidoglycan interpeptide bridge formation enzyme)